MSPNGDVVWLAGLKRKILIGLIVVVVAGGLMVQHRRADQHATFQGIDARAWAADFYPNFDPRSTNIAMIAFRAMGSNAVPTLRRMLNTREPWYARLFVQQHKRLPATTRASLAGKIKPGRTIANRIAAARALGVVGASATTAVPDLIAALDDADTQWAAAQALASIGGQAIPALATAATNQDANVRHAAVYGLGQAGTNASMATGVLLERVLDPNLSVQASALYSLGQIGRSGLPTVLEAFSTSDAVRRDAATQAIKTMNKPPRQVLSALLEFSTNSSPKLRQNSIEALRALHMNHPYVVASYFEATADADAGVRVAAARAFAQANVWSTNVALSDAVVRLLGRSGSFDSNVVATLTALLNDSEIPVRDAARETLAGLNSPGTN